MFAIEQASATPAVAAIPSSSPPPAFPDWLNDLVHTSAPVVSDVQQVSTIPMMPAVMSAAIEARRASIRRREQLVNDHLALHGVWPKSVAMSALEIIALPVDEWAAFCPDHGIVVSLEPEKEGHIAC